MRPSKLTPELIEALAEAIRRGMTYKLAAQHCRIGESTIHHWRSRGREAEEGPEHDLVLALEEAEAQCAVECLDMIRLAAVEQWQAAAWILERRHGYRVQQSIEVSGPEGASIQVSAWSDLAQAAES